jgi:hypothetical protein
VAVPEFAAPIERATLPSLIERAGIVLSRDDG